jgi:class 3 adenylate cyclase
MTTSVDVRAQRWNPDRVRVEDEGSAGIRVSDAERDAVVTALRGHFESGRLSFDEFSERIDEAYAARTDIELDAALRELPRQPSNVHRRPRPHPPRRRRRGHAPWQRWAASHYTFVNGICIAVWAASGAGYFWPIWVLIPTTAMFLRRVIAGGDEHEPLESPYESTTAPPQREASEPASRRVVMSVLFVDIVSSTERASALGDAAWHSVLYDYERHVDKVLAALRGEKLFTKGDEVVAGFLLPASAVEAGLRVCDAARELGLEVRAGVHAGEVDRIANQANGIAMHIGRRVCEAAAPSQVLVSSTVHDLLAGSSMHFTEAGDHELKGLTGTWRLYQPDRT